MRRLLPLLSIGLLAGCAAAPDQPAPVAQPAVTEVGSRPGQEGWQGWLYQPTDRSTPRPGVLLLHDDYGVNPWEKEQAQRLAELGYVVLLLDLYRGEQAGDLMDAHILGRALPDDQVSGDIRSALDFLEKQPGVRRDAFGVMGWQMGGGYALDAAIHDPRLRAVVVCYGRLTTDPGLLAGLHGPVLGIFAGKDQGIPAETIHAFEAAMRKAGRRVAGITVYPQRGTGFMNPGGPDKPGPSAQADTEDAWKRIDAFLAAELKP